MPQLLPAPFLVRYRLPVPRFDRLPRSGQRALDLPATARLAWPRALEQADLPVEMRAGWNPHGLGFALTVVGRSTPIVSDPEQPTRPDSFELWIDTRDTQTVHRATRYCHHLCVLPTGGGDDGRSPLVKPSPVARARDDAPLADEDAFLTRRKLIPHGYELEVWIPAEALHGFDPATQPRLGFCCRVNDAEHGVIPFSVGDEFPATSDPSLWHSLELQDA